MFFQCLFFVQQNKQILIDAVVHAVNEDYAEMANDFTRLGFLASGTDVAPIIPALESIWQNSAGKGLADFNFRSVTGNIDLHSIVFVLLYTNCRILNLLSCYLFSSWSYDLRKLLFLSHFSMFAYSCLVHVFFSSFNEKCLAQHVIY